MSQIVKAPITVLVPAHNEADQIAETIESLMNQTLRPSKIIVIADNCTDDTVAVASRYPVTVMETVGNSHKKAGALNQAWLAHAQDAKFIFSMDADTVLSSNFFELAMNLMEDQPDVGGACVCPTTKPIPEDASRYGAILWRLWRLDFGGYMRTLCRWKMAPEVLSGIGTILRGTALKEVALEYGGAPWDVNSIVEDYRLSLDLRRLGYRLSIIPGALAFTDAPIRIGGAQGLWRQRMRWSGGTWQELVREGWEPRSRRIWLTTLGCAGASVLRVVAVLLWLTVLALGYDIAWSWWWLIPLVISIVDRLDMLRYTKNSDWKDTLMVLSFLPIEIVCVLREAWTVRSAWITLRRHSLAW